MAVGMAIAERHLNAEFGDELVDHRTWVIAGDGCLMEGISHEAIGLAGHLKLGRLIVLWDDNHITIDGATDLSTSEDITRALSRPTGWHVVSCDGHDVDDVARGDRRGAGRPAPVADRLQDDHRQGRAEQAGHQRHPRLGAGRGRGRRRARDAGLDATPPFEIPSRHLRRLERRPASAASGQRGEWEAPARRPTPRAEFDRAA